jgi:hypothetical protein
VFLSFAPILYPKGKSALCAKQACHNSLFFLPCHWCVCVCVCVFMLCVDIVV